MAEIWTRATRQRQPQGAVAVDWANPITHGLASLISGDRNFTFGRPDGPLAISQKRVSTPSGLALSTSASGEYIRTQNITDTTSIDTGATIAALWIGSGLNSTSAYRGIQCYGLLGGQVVLAYGINPSGTAQVSYGNGANAALTTTIPNDTKLHFTSVSRRASSTSATFVIDRTTEVFSVGTSNGSGNSPQLLGIFRTDATTENWFANYLLGAVWKRALSTSELLSLSANPWQLFAPERRVSYFFPASGIPTLSAATAVSIGSTTATPRVTVTF